MNAQTVGTFITSCVIVKCVTFFTFLNIKVFKYFKYFYGI